ncbi:MAG: HAD family hydrolase [Deltaproteobacteria bacterium]|jgi:phosphoglycolate phosphatase|nr:HAD family hydrolase [Deltaproteobacteria bacterium]
MGGGPQGVIFDLDGTLLDTLDDLRFSLEAALEKRGLGRKFSREEFKGMVGNGMTALVRRGLPADMAGDEGLVASVRVGFKDVYARELTRRTVPYEGVEDLLSGLAGLGASLGVLSNKDEDDVGLLMDHFFPGRFPRRLGAKPGRPVKPDPAGGLELAALMGLEPAGIVYLGDSEVDMRTAKNCGFLAVGVSWGFRGAEVLKESGADRVIGSPREFWSVLPDAK